MEMVEEHIKGILKNRKIHFTLIDPDEQTPQEALKIAEEAILGGTDGIMIGGSTVIMMKLMKLVKYYLII